MPSLLQMLQTICDARARRHRAGVHSEADAPALALQEVAKESGGGVVRPLLAFYIASAYEYGVAPGRIVLRR